MMNEALIEIRDLLESSVGSSVIKTFYAGRVGIPAKNYLPAVIVEEVSTEIVRANTEKDMFKYKMSILVILDVITDFSTQGVNDDTPETYKRLRNIIEEADTDGAPKTTTILGALLRKQNIRGTNYVYNINPFVNYRPAFPGQDQFWYIAAQIDIDFMSDFVTRKS